MFYINIKLVAKVSPAELEVLGVHFLGLRMFQRSTYYLLIKDGN